MAAYDDQNVFAKILRGEMPCAKLHEDEETLPFMDIMPRADGHCLVIPKAPSRNLLDIEPGDLAAVIRTVQKVAKAAKQAMDADGVMIQQFSEPASGQVVFHTHFHVLPCFDGVALKPPGQMGDMEEISAHAEKIRAALAG